MGQVILYIAMSIDVYIADDNDSIDWLTPFDGLDYGYEPLLAQTSSVIVGRSTYDTAKSFPEWPYPKHHTYVVTRHPETFTETDNPPVSFHNVDDVVKAVRDAEADSWLVGGGQVIAEFLTRKAIDVMRIFVMPLTLGDGVRLFSPAANISHFKTARPKLYENGVVELIYRTN